jgi:hypothetical protein
MATLGESFLEQFALPTFPVRRFTVEEYQQLSATGVIGEDDHVELIEGWIVQKMNRNPPHDATIQIVHEWLLSVLPKGWRCRIQSGFVTDDSQPEPDLVLIEGEPRKFARRHPGSNEASLVIEVAESSLMFDRTEKSRLYARARVPVLWIVNLIDEQIEVLSEPTGPRDKPVFQKQTIYQRDETITLTLNHREIGSIKVADLLP